MSIQNGKYRFVGFLLDTNSRQLLSPADETVVLSSKAFEVLRVLVERQGETVPKSELIEAAWPGVVVEANNLSQVICSLRKALQDSTSPGRIIHTIPGRGYCFVASVDKLVEEDLPSRSVVTPPPTEYGPPKPEYPDTCRESAGSRIKPKITPLSYVGLPFLLIVALMGALTMPNWPHDEAGPAAADVTHFVDGPEDQGFPGVIDRSIAVLPFIVMNASESGDDELLANGLQQEIINKLTSFRSLKVISQTSVIPILERVGSATETGKRLGVKSILRGTIHFKKSSANISLELSDPHTGVLLWAKSYVTDRRSLDDLVSIESKIALSVAQVLEAEEHADRPTQETLRNMPTNSFAAYRYNIAASNAYHNHDIMTALKLSQQALALDPEYYDALYLYGTLNLMFTSNPLDGMSSHDHYMLALETANSITRLHPDKAGGYILKTYIYGANKEWEEMEEQREILRSMNVPLSDLHLYGGVLLALGYIHDAIDIYETTLLIQPINPNTRSALVMAYEVVGEGIQAKQEYELGKQLSGAAEWWGDTYNLVLSLGRRERLQHIDNAPGLSDNVRHALHSINAKRNQDVRADLNQYIESGKVYSTFETILFSAIAAHLGETKMAIELARTAVKEDWRKLHWLWLPVFDEVRKQEDFKMLVRDSGLVDYWQKFGWPEMCHSTGDSFVCN